MKSEWKPDHQSKLEKRNPAPLFHKNKSIFSESTPKWMMPQFVFLQDTCFPKAADHIFKNVSDLFKSTNEFKNK